MRIWSMLSDLRWSNHAKHLEMVRHHSKFQLCCRPIPWQHGVRTAPTDGWWAPYRSHKPISWSYSWSEWRGWSHAVQRRADSREVKNPPSRPNDMMMSEQCPKISINFSDWLPNLHDQTVDSRTYKLQLLVTPVVPNFFAPVVSPSLWAKTNWTWLNPIAWAREAPTRNFSWRVTAELVVGDWFGGGGCWVWLNYTCP